SVITGTGRWRRDRSVQGNPIKIGDRRLARGLGVAADSVLHFEVPPGTSEFVAEVGFDDEVASQAGSNTLRFAVVLDGVEVHRHAGVPPGQSIPVRVPVGNARKLTLIVEGASLSPWAHGDWGDARFIRGDSR